MERGHELRVAADAGEVGDGAARGGYAGLCCGGLGGEYGVSDGGALGIGGEVVGVVLTAQSGSSERAPRSKRAPALANGAARRVRVAMEYFILIYIDFFFRFFFWF